MARQFANLESSQARAKLDQQGKPHVGLQLAPGLRLGYRRNKGAGAWVGIVTDGKGGKNLFSIASADDPPLQANGVSVLSYWQACQRAPIRAREEGHLRNAGPIGKPATFAEALDRYRDDLRSRGGYLGNASQVLHHLTAELRHQSLATITAEQIGDWRTSLINARRIKPATVARVWKSARAALRLAARDPRIGENWRRISDNLEPISDEWEPVDRVRTDAEVAAIVAECYALDFDFGLFVEVLQQTGTRESQAKKLAVTDLRFDGEPQLNLPWSRKGKGRQRITRKEWVPISPALAAQLKARAAAGSRIGLAPLLVWDRRFFAPRDGWFTKITSKLGLTREVIRKGKPVIIPDTAYCLRHSSITRRLVAGQPIRLVAAQHNTSVAMIEKTYGAHIAKHAGEAARLGLLDLAATPRLVASGAAS